MSGTAQRWEHFGHGADIGVRGVGQTMAEAFAGAAEALTSVVCTLADVRPATAVEVTCRAPSADLLLVDWLNAIVFEMATRRMLFSRFTVDIDDGGLRGRMWGEPVDPNRHQPAVEVKGATLTELRVERRTDDGAWIAQCIVDV